MKLRDIKSQLILEGIELINKYNDTNVDYKLSIDSIMNNLTELWHKEYKDSSKDEDIYDHPDFLWNALICADGVGYNNVHKTVKFFKDIEYTPKNILDFGAGIGITTILLAQALPNTEIIYQNIGKIQKDIFKTLLSKFPCKNIKIVETIEEIENLDVIVCFDLFEHIKEPESLFSYLDETLNMNFFIEASSFKMYDRPGHYDTYKYRDKIISNIEMNKEFRSMVRGAGYADSSKIYGKSCWNSRPRVWVKQKSKKII